MMSASHIGLPRRERTVIMRACVTFATLVTLCLSAACAFAQQKPEAARDDLDVTMQIIVDPDAKLPDELIRRIPLPARKPTQPAPASGKDADKSDPPASDRADKGQERAREAQELGREMSERAKDLAKEAAEQREQARRSTAEERRRNPGRPDPPGRPPTPPRP